MLSSLHIENVAVIEKADVEFGPGFNVLTGETGAGKSILIDSIAAALGSRVSRDIVRHGTDKALVTAVFTGINADEWLRENDIEPEDELILQRRITADGKSSCKINGCPVSVSVLRELGDKLLMINGQNDGRQLLDEQTHLACLDSFGDTESFHEDYLCSYAKYTELKKKIKSLKMSDMEKEYTSAKLNKVVEELSKAKLKPGEEEELSERFDYMKNSEKLSEALNEAYGLLYTSSSSSISQAEEAMGYIDGVKHLSPELMETAKALNDAVFLLRDAAERASDLLEGLDFSPEDFDRISQRLSLIKKLSKKYDRDENGLIELLNESNEKLYSITSSDELIESLKKELAYIKKELIEKGKALSEERKKAAAKLSERIAKELADLSMPSVRFCALVSPKSGEEKLDSSGIDDVRFLMSANAGEDPGRISKIASGGELSRIMLALRSALSDKDNTPSLIFDEIDTGVSGIAASRVAEKMAELSENKQIICISHLPQIAAMADSHYRISKAEKNGRTYTTLEELDMEGKTAEVARLQGGDSITDNTLTSARELIIASETFKERKNK